MKLVCKIIILVGILMPLTSSRHVQFYRKDYTYIEEFDAFYKVHWSLYGLSWDTAFSACNDEGATLFYPKEKDEWTVVKNLTENMAQPPNVTDIFVGLHDEFKLGEFITVDGHSTSSPLHIEELDTFLEFGGNCVIMNIETGTYGVSSCVTDRTAPLPFVCKKVDDQSCPTIDHGYKYVKSVNKCYKVNEMKKMWDDAMRTCFMEGAMLVVLENEGEARAISTSLQMGATYFVGSRRLFLQSELYTVKGQKISDVYQNPNGYTQGNECGTISAQNPIYTTTNDCGTRLPFICEMEVKA